MKDKINIPDPLAKWEDKKKDAYGLSWAYLISKDWFNGGQISSDCEFSTRRDWVINKRLIARGEQDDQKYKAHVSRHEGDMTYLNLDWRIVNIPGKFCRTVANGIKDEYYNLDIRANDKFTLLRKKNKMEEHRANMRTLPLMKKAKEVLNVDVIPKGFIPEDEQELQLWTEVQDRPKIEMAEEIIIKYVKDVNSYEHIEDTKNNDLVEAGVAGARVWTDPVEGIKLEPIDVENLIHSYVKKNDFSDAYYYGLVDEITINDIARESGFTDDKLRKIAESYSALNKRSYHWATCKVSDFLDFKVQIVRFAFKTSKTIVWKKHNRNGGTVKVTRKDEDFNPPERTDYGKLSMVKDTWMEGTYILGTDLIYNYKECENIIRDELNKPLPPFRVRATNIYQNRLRSFLDDIEPLADQMQYIHLKIQHLVAEIKPDLVEIDVDSLAELPTKGDKKHTWETALNMMNVKGIVFTKRIDMGEMGLKDSPGVKPMPTQQGTGLTVLLNAWAHYYQMIRDTTGVNPARDGSLPADALLGVNEMAQLASNTSTKHIVNASVELNKDICETISSRVHQIFNSKDAKHLQEMYKKAVGKENIEALEPLADRHLHDFGFTVEMVPSKQQMDEFKEDLLISLQDGTIDVEIKSQAQQIAKGNIKLATQYLFYMRKKKQKERMEEEAKMSQMKSQNDMQAAQAAQQATSQTYAAQRKVDLDYEARMSQIRLAEEQALQQVRAPEKDKEFQQEVYLKQLEIAKDMNIKGFLEDRKDDRTRIQATQQSKMIPQRKSDNPVPIDFENQSKFNNIFNN